MKIYTVTMFSTDNYSFIRKFENSIDLILKRKQRPRHLFEQKPYKATDQPITAYSSPWEGSSLKEGCGTHCIESA